MHTTSRSFAKFLAAAAVAFCSSQSMRAVAAPDAVGFGLLATGQDVGDQYVTLTSTGGIHLRNVGPSALHITNVASTDTDALNGYLRVAATFPMTLQPGDTAYVPVVFAPNAPNILAGERSYSATFTVTSEANPQTAKVTGRGVLVRAHTSMAADLKTKEGDSVDVPVRLDQWTDPIGNADIRGLRFELFHYRRTVVAVRPAYNTTGAGQASTMLSGATVVEDVATDTLSDPAHTSGQQGFYSLVASGISTPVRGSGILLNLRLAGVKGVDTSHLDVLVKDPRNASGTALKYIIFTATAGIIRVDTVKKQDTVVLTVHPPASAPAHDGLTLSPGSPNPFSTSTNITFSLRDQSHAQLYVCDVRGQIVARLVDGPVTAGEHQASFAAGTFPSGEYYVVLRTPSGIVKQTLGLVR